jgi:hypothetical protein
MATVTAFTAQKTQEILDQTIKSMTVPTTGSLAGHLIATYWDGTTKDLGSVIGPQGEDGPSGGVSQAYVDDEIALHATEEESARNLAILYAAMETGSGIEKHTQVGTEVNLGSGSPNTNVTIPGASVTFTTTQDFYYRITGTALFNTTDAAGSYFDLHIMDGSTVLARGSAYAANANRSVGCVAHRIIKAPSTWNATAKNFTLACRYSTASGTVKVAGDYTPACISIEMIGAYV